MRDSSANSMRSQQPLCCYSPLRNGCLEPNARLVSPKSELDTHSLQLDDIGFDNSTNFQDKNVLKSKAGMWHQ
eukprot:1159696-Pelagomonas_calceolata.AAC.12